MTAEHRILLDTASAAAHAAGVAILDIYRQDFNVRHKADASPVTRADEEAEAIIEERLAAAAPEIPIIAEERCAAQGLPSAAPPRFWLVDPLDGTKEFISRNGEFTVNIALVECGRPRLGLVYAPALGRLFAGGEGVGAWVEEDGLRRAISTRAVPEAGLTVVGSRWHGDDAAVDAFLAGRRVAERAMVGSSLKLCLIAEGAADVYPRFGRTMEWDIAAGDAILRAAGGTVRTLDGAPLRYGKAGFDNPDFVAWGRAPAPLAGD